MESHRVGTSRYDRLLSHFADPLTQFTCVLAALLHDVDHVGVSNPQLIEEKPELGAKFKHRSVAEQNSLWLSWELLMEPKYDDLRNAIYSTPDELRRFRELLVNSILAMDIMDKELKVLRNNRWDVAFSEKKESHSSLSTNRKATIVIEHLIQASDVSHTSK